MGSSRYKAEHTAAASGDWTGPQDETMLAALLASPSKEMFAGTCDHLAAAFNRGNPKTGRPRGEVVRRRFWAICNRLHDYTPMPGIRKLRRKEWPLTWGEQYAVKLATLTHSQEARQTRPAAPDAAYVAAVLSCTPALAAAAIQRYGPAQGRKGLVL
jgi:hypothetical protein